MKYCTVSEALNVSRKVHSPAMMPIDVKKNVQDQDRRLLLPPAHPSPMYIAKTHTHCHRRCRRHHHHHHHHASPTPSPSPPCRTRISLSGDFTDIDQITQDEGLSSDGCCLCKCLVPDVLCYRRNPYQQHSICDTQAAGIRQAPFWKVAQRVEKAGMSQRHAAHIPPCQERRKTH